MFGFKARKAAQAAKLAAEAKRSAEFMLWFAKAEQDDYESDADFYGTERANSNRRAAQADLAMRGANLDSLPFFGNCCADDDCEGHSVSGWTSQDSENYWTD